MDTLPVTANTLISLQAVRSFSSFSAPINALAFTDDSQYVLVSADDRSLQVFSVLSGRHIATCTSFPDGVCQVCPTHHSHAVLYANSQGSQPTVTYYHWKRQQELWRSTEPTRRVAQLSMSPMSDSFLCVSGDGSIRLYDLRKRQSVGSYEVLNVYGHCACAYDPTGTIFALGASDARNAAIRLFDLRNWQSGPYLTKSFPGGAQVTSLEISDDGKLTLLCTSDCRMTLLDSLSLDIQRSFQLDSSAGASPKAVFSACSAYIAAGVSTHPTVQLFSSGSGERLHTLSTKDNVRAVAWNKDYLVLAVGGSKLDLWLPEINQ